MEMWQERRHFYTDTVDLSPEDHRVKFNGVLYPVKQVSAMWMRQGGEWHEDPGVGVHLAFRKNLVLSRGELDEIPPWLENLIEISRPKGD